VIGIIALLISILLPSLARARESANTIKCASNMRQLVNGLLMYCNDSKGKLPPMWVDPGGGGSRPWPDGFHWGAALVQGNYLKAPNCYDNSTNTWKVQGNNTFECPSILSWDVASSANAPRYPRDIPHFLPNRYAVGPSGAKFGVLTSYTVPWDRKDYASTKSLPFCLFWDGVGGSLDSSWFQKASVQRTLSMVRKAGEVVAITESTSGPAYYKYGPTDPSPTPTYYPRANAARHGKPVNNGYDGITNLAFFDGHVASFSTVSMSKNSGTTTAIKGEYIYMLGDQY
jgi:prepilin-type processing-associated H-X9-DG protein